MITYCIIISTILILSAGFNMGRNNGEGALTSLTTLLIYLPIFGRIFGWW